MVLKWLTPDSSPEGTRDIKITVPTGMEWEAIVRGALASLFNPANFEQFGQITPEDTAQIFMEAGFQWLIWEDCP